MAKKILDYSGLRYGAITPSDIDGALEFDGRLFVFIEAKRTGAEIFLGQRLMYERITDAIHMPPNRIATSVIVDHEDIEGVDVDMAKSTVRAYRWSGRWLLPLQKGQALCVFMDRMIAYSENMRRQKLRVIDGGIR